MLIHHTRMHVRVHLFFYRCSFMAGALNASFYCAQKTKFHDQREITAAQDKHDRDCRFCTDDTHLHLLALEMLL